MDTNEILKKAIYIQYPINYTQYKEYDIKGIKRLPLPKQGEMYDNWKLNHNHFTTEYHRKYSLPLLCELLHLPFDVGDFKLIKMVKGNNDISLLKPKNEYFYEIFGYTRGEHFDNLSFNNIIFNDSNKNDITDYHRLYRYSHECSRLINKTIANDRKLFISGDSQMIPDISFLSCFFKEIWYFDNRKRIPLYKEIENVTFTDVLIELNHLNISEYLKTNFM